MMHIKNSLSDGNKTQVNESGSKFLNQFQDVFIDDIPGELPPNRGDDDHAIELIPGSSPPNKSPYRVSQAQQEEIMRQVNKLVEKGMVRPSSSPFCSPVLLVHKKDGTYCMCVNYRALNKITIKNRFPVPRIEDLFDKLQGSTYFSRIDLKSGYHQIRIVNEDILKTAFRTTFGLYEYLVMPFGLTNAPATFNRMMERIFRPHRNFTGVFFDDVIIYSKSMEKHKKHLQVPMPKMDEHVIEENMCAKEMAVANCQVQPEEEQHVEKGVTMSLPCGNDKVDPGSSLVKMDGDEVRQRHMLEEQVQVDKPLVKEQASWDVLEEEKQVLHAIDLSKKVCASLLLRMLVDAAVHWAIGKVQESVDESFTLHGLEEESCMSRMYAEQVDECGGTLFKAGWRQGNAWSSGRMMEWMQFI
ncbi:hypothetical protein L7F22_031631 [Adiantum nelumboides]|nr:hypothetical protein [Adiantum nelumboides]